MSEPTMEDTVRKAGEVINELNERIALAATKTVPGGTEDVAVKTLAVTGGEKEGAAGPLPAASSTVTPDADPEAAATALLAIAHDDKSAAAAYKVAVADGASFVIVDGKTALRLKSGEVMPLAQGLGAIGAGPLLRPVGSPGSGGRGGGTRPVSGTTPVNAGILQRFADSGNDLGFYRQHRDEILAARYGRAPMTRLK
jgi:hypothetical protein